ncbi:MAG: Inorganic pyrophosphatase [Holdemanella sp.]|nr:Inorganic pyrophosphatase [Holdemanella sp.]
MTALENNAYFWQKIDTLVLSSTYKVDRPAGTTHNKYTNLVYPVDYGYLQDTYGNDQMPIAMYVGSISTFTVDAIAISIDILKKDCEVKFLLGCTEEETLKILEFLNQTEFQKAILVRRGNDTPAWAVND